MSSATNYAFISILPAFIQILPCLGDTIQTRSSGKELDFIFLINLNFILILFIPPRKHSGSIFNFNYQILVSSEVLTFLLLSCPLILILLMPQTPFVLTRLIIIILASLISLGFPNLSSFFLPGGWPIPLDCRRKVNSCPETFFDLTSMSATVTVSHFLITHKQPLQKYTE